MQFLYSPQYIFFSAALALVGAAILARSIIHIPIANEKAKTIASAIREGAMAFLIREYRILIIFIIGIALLINFSPLGPKRALAFIAGALLSAIAGNIGMRIATRANVRTAEAVQTSFSRGLRIAFDSGSVMGLTVVGLGLGGVALFSYWLTQSGDSPDILYAFGFGASLIALFARVGGGIYTKAADIGADLVGKIESGIPEDDPRNPATIADNVGDNVGDVAGMGADLFESYVDTIIAAMVIGFALPIAIGDSLGTELPLGLAAIGVTASVLGSVLSHFINARDPQKTLNASVGFTTLLAALGAAYLIRSATDSYMLFWPFLIGLAAGIGIGLLTEYYTTSSRSPARNVAAAAKTGAATNIIAGFSLGLRSTFLPILIIAGAIYFSFAAADDVNGIYGIAIAAIGMLSTLGITLAADTYGPVADNAAGIAEMSGLGGEARKRAEALDAVGNTTAAIGKGFAIGAAALTSIVLLVSYAAIAGITKVDVLNPSVFIGLFIGGMTPFLFSSLALSSVGRAAIKMVSEVRRQFREIPGLAQGTGRPDYARCVSISTESALKEMILPGLIAVLTPLVIGLIIGKEALGGLLAGSIVTGFLLAIAMANAGGAWDNAKKYVEAGNFGGKGSAAHRAAVVGDTVGDPFKDTAGPALNILLKLMAIVALIIAPLL